MLPATSADAILDALKIVVPALRREGSEPCRKTRLGVGLWIPASVARRLDSDAGRARAFAQELRSFDLEVFTLNGFPFGDFHGERVKENVFVPSWADPARLEYTLGLGRLLAAWLPEGEHGSISTVAAGFKRLHRTPGFARACAGALLELAWAWHRMEQETGRRLVLGLEPEPGSTLETTAEVVRFFEDHLLHRPARDVLRRRGLEATRIESVVRRHVGVCYDACHQAVMFEHAAEALGRLEAAGIEIAKLQVTNALEVPRPGADEERLGRLAQFAEPRYLHQVTRPEGGGAAYQEDLEGLLARPGPEWLAAERWRIHFHVPVHRDEVSGFATTRPELAAALETTVRRNLTSHFEVETYTWGVLPDEVRSRERLGPGLARELAWTCRTLEEIGARW